MKALSSYASFKRFLRVVLPLTLGVFVFSHYGEQSNFHEFFQPDHLTIMSNGSLSPGFGMGVNTSDGNTAWVRKVADAQVMAYPGGAWGAVFVTIGNPVRPGNRPSRDFSGYTALSVELKGTSGKTVQIGLKSNSDNDDGSETKVAIQITNDGWNFYNIRLNRFESADTRHLYVVSEFVFDDQPETISVRNIQFTR